MTAMLRGAFWRRHQRVLAKNGYLLREMFCEGYDPASGNPEEDKASHLVAATPLSGILY